MMWWLRLRRHYYLRKTTSPEMCAFLQADMPQARTSVNDVKFLAVDLETTALKPEEGEIASIAWVPIQGSGIHLSGAEQYYIAVTCGVGQSAVYHQIRDSELAVANSLREVIAHFLTVAAGKVLVFHGAALDMGFLSAATRRLYNAPVVAPIVDTLSLEKQNQLQTNPVPIPGALRLFACRARFGLPEYPAHHALTDAIAAAELLLAQIAYRGKRARLATLL